MARRVRTRAGSIVTTGPQVAAPVVTDDEDATRRYLAASVQISGYVATITVQIPAGQTMLLVKPPLGLSEQYAVTGGQPFSFGFTRPAPAAAEHPHMTLYLGFPGETDSPVPLNFVRTGPDTPAGPVPVTLVSAGSLATSGIVGAGVVATPPVWGGDMTATENFIFTGSTEGGAVTPTSALWTTIPNLVGTWYRLGSRAYGPTVADPDVNGWTDWVYTAAAQIAAAPAAWRLTGADVTVLRSEYRPSGQTTYFTPIVAFPGLTGQTVNEIDFTAADLATADPTWHAVTASVTAGEWELFDNGHPVGTPTADAGLFSVGNVRNGRLRFRWRVAADQPWSEASVVFTVPAPAVTPIQPLKTTFRPTQAVVQDAVATGNNNPEANFGGGPYQNYWITNYGRSGEGDSSVGLYAKWDIVTAMISAWAGDNYSCTIAGASKLIVEHCVDQLLRWASDVGDNAPPCRSGYHAQHEMRFACAVAIARITPAVWDHARLNAAAKYKTRLRYLMQALLVSNAAVASATIPSGWSGYVVAGGQRTIRGYSAGHSNVPNFSSPPRLTPHVVAAFMEADTGSATAAQDFLTAFNRATFSAQLEAIGGIVECRATFAQDWTEQFQHQRYGSTTYSGGATVSPMWSTIGPGHTAAQLHAAIRPNGGAWRSVAGHTLAQYREAFALELRDRTFSKTVRPGPMNVEKPTGTGRGEAGPTGSGWTSQQYGIRYTTRTTHNSNVSGTQILRACVGRPIQVNGVWVTDKSAWAGIPNPNAIGLPDEFDTSDGPVSPADGPGKRSSVSYAIGGLGATMIAFATMIIYGKFSPTDAIWSDTKARFNVGVAFLDYIAKHGYLSYAKGGSPSSNNENWDAAYMVAQRVKWPSFMSLANAIADWWDAPAVTSGGPTVLRGWLKPKWFLSGSGTQTVSTAGVFTSAVTSYAFVGAVPAGVTINASTGVVSVTTGASYSWATVTVRGTGATGSTDISFALRVITANHTVAANAALSSVSPTSGQIVVYRGGTNTSLLDLSAWTNVEVFAYPGETPIINLAAQTRDVGIRLGAVSGLKLYGLDIRGGAGVDHGIGAWGASNITVSCCSVSGFNRTGINTYFSNHSAARPWIVEYNRVSGNTIENAAHTWTSGWGRGIALDVADNSVIRRNWVYENHGEGIGVLACDGVTVSENYTWDNWSANIYCDGAQMTTVTGNTIWSDNAAFYRDFDGAGPASAAPAKSVLSANENYPSETWLEQSTVSLSAANNRILATNVLPYHDATYGKETEATTSAFTPNTTFASPVVAWET